MIEESSSVCSALTTQRGPDRNKSVNTLLDSTFFIKSLDTILQRLY